MNSVFGVNNHLPPLGRWRKWYCLYLYIHFNICSLQIVCFLIHFWNGYNVCISLMNELNKIFNVLILISVWETQYSFLKISLNNMHVLMSYIDDYPFSFLMVSLYIPILNRRVVYIYFHSFPCSFLFEHLIYSDTVLVYSKSTDNYILQL